MNRKTFVKSILSAIPLLAAIPTILAFNKAKKKSRLTISHTRHYDFVNFWSNREEYGNYHNGYPYVKGVELVIHYNKDRTPKSIIYKGERVKDFTSVKTNALSREHDIIVTINY